MSTVKPTTAMMPNDAPPGATAATPSGEGAGGKEAAATRETLVSRVSELERDLAEARRLACEVRQEQAAQQALHDAGVIDLEAGLLLVKQRLTGGAAADVPAAVAAIRKAKPGLFRPAGGAAGGGGRRAPSPAAMPSLADEPADALRQAATHAQQTGDRRSLLEYLRLRRGQAAAEAAD